MTETETAARLQRTEALADRIAKALHEGDVAAWDEIVSDAPPDAAGVFNTIAIHHCIAQQKQINELKVCNEALRRRVVDLELAIGPAESATMKTVLLRISNLENHTARPDFAGTWKAGTLYPRNCQVVHDGSTWVATVAKPAGVPGAPASGWVLSAKGGR